MNETAEEITDILENVYEMVEATDQPRKEQVLDLIEEVRGAIIAVTDALESGDYESDTVRQVLRNIRDNIMNNLRIFESVLFENFMQLFVDWLNYIYENYPDIRRARLASAA